MRQLLLGILLLVSMSSVSAQTEEADAAMGAALTDYSAVSGGWYLNERCWFLTGEAKDKFTQDLELINIALLRDLGRADSLRGIQRGAQQATTQAPYNACGDVAKEIVVSTARHAELWAEEIRKLLAEIASQRESEQQNQPENEAE